MKNKLSIGIMLLIIVLSGCDKKEEAVGPEPSLYYYSFLKEDNPSLKESVHLINYGSQITGRLPFDADVKNLVGTYEYVGEMVKIGDEQQESGVTANDFTQIQTYSVTNSDGTTKNFNVDAIWFTGLPMFNIVTLDAVEIESKDEYVQGKGIFYGSRSYDDGSGDMKIRGRGHSTWGLHPKKPYQLKFDEKTEVFGMPADKKWIFLAEYSDKTLMRNRLAFEMGYMSRLDWTPKCVYAEVFVNDDYRGTYNITQKVEQSSHRVDIGETGYLLEIDTPDHLGSDDIFFYSSKFLFQIKEPEVEIGSAEFNYIEDHIRDFETALFSQNFTNPETGYKKFIDMASFVDWYLINEIAKNQDARNYSSIYLNHIPGEKIKMGPLWDFDLGFGNVDYSDCQFPTEFWVKDNAYISRMFEDPDFVNQVKERFLYFKSKQSDILQIIYNQASKLKYAQEENDIRWDLYGNYVWPNPVVYDSHEQEVNHLKDWFVRRMNWLDEAYRAM